MSKPGDIRETAARCRRLLASGIDDPVARAALTELAEECERKIAEEDKAASDADPAD